MGFELLFISWGSKLENDFDHLITILQAEVEKRDMLDFSPHALNLFKNPVNFKSLPMETPGLVISEGYSDCGDFIQFFLKFIGDQIEDITYLYQGCDVTSIVASQLVLLTRSKSVYECSKVSIPDVLHALGMFPPENEHTIVFLQKVLNKGIDQYLLKKRCSK